MKRFTLPLATVVALIVGSLSSSLLKTRYAFNSTGIYSQFVQFRFKLTGMNFKDILRADIFATKMELLIFSKTQ